MAWRSGNPKLNRRLAEDEAEADEGADAAAEELPYEVVLGGGASFVERFPYLFFKYLAQELKASLSPSDPPPPRSGETSRDFKAWVDRLRESSEADDAPYLN